MTLKRVSALFIAFCFSCSWLMAAQKYQFSEGTSQTNYSEGNEAKTDSLDEKEAIPYVMFKDKSAVGLNIGTRGFGLEYARNFHKSLNAKLRFSTLSLEYDDISVKEGDRELEGAADFKSTNVDLILEYLPFKRSSFHLDAGFAYFFDLTASGVGKYKGEVTYGDITLTSEQIGEVNFAIDWNSFSPYMGLGFGRSVPKGRVGFGVDLGAYYIGSPEVSIVGTNLLSGNSEEEPVLEGNLKNYSWWPYLNFKLSIKL